LTLHALYVLSRSAVYASPSHRLNHSNAVSGSESGVGSVIMVMSSRARSTTRPRRASALSSEGDETAAASTSASSSSATPRAAMKPTAASRKRTATQAKVNKEDGVARPALTKKRKSTSRSPAVAAAVTPVPTKSVEVASSPSSTVLSNANPSTPLLPPMVVSIEHCRS